MPNDTKLTREELKLLLSCARSDTLGTHGDDRSKSLALLEVKLVRLIRRIDHARYIYAIERGRTNERAI